MQFVFVLTQKSHVSKTKNEDTDSFSVVDLALPASTNVQDIIRQLSYYKRNGNKGLTVVFSTYQSIEVISSSSEELLKNYRI